VFQAEDGIRDDLVTGVQTCALPIWYIPIFSWIMEARCRRSGRRMHLTGRFSGTAGDSSGTVVLQRIPLPNRVKEYHGLPLRWLRSEERRVGKECSWWCGKMV